MTARWGQTLGAGIALGLVALATNVPLDEWAGGGDTALAVRLTASKLVNSGTAWAGLGFLAGWLFILHPNRPPRSQARSLPTRGALIDAAIAAVIASELALVVHYALGQAVGHFDANIWWANKSWFVAAVVMGMPMGIIGASAHRLDAFGLAARLVVPAGAVIEPVLRGFFHAAPENPDTVRMAAATSGVVLVMTGLLGALVVLAHALRRRRGAVVGTTH